MRSNRVINSTSSTHSLMHRLLAISRCARPSANIWSAVRSAGVICNTDDSIRLRRLSAPCSSVRYIGRFIGRPSVVQMSRRHECGAEKMCAKASGQLACYCSLTLDAQARRAIDATSASDSNYRICPRSAFSRPYRGTDREVCDISKSSHVVRQRGGWILDDRHAVAVLREDLVHTAPTGPVGERSLDEHNVPGALTLFRF